MRHAFIEWVQARKEGEVHKKAVPSEESQRISEAYDRSKAISPWRYSYFNLSNLLLQQELERRILKLMGPLTGRELGDKKILDVGCGTGRLLRQFIRWGARPGHLAGVDLLPDLITKARELCPASVHLVCREASSLGFEDNSFDIVFQSMAFTSILEMKMKEAIAREMLRVVRREGFVLWYDFFVNNPRNPDVQGIGKKELRHLFQGCRIHCERVTLAAPLGRLLGRFSAIAYRMASGLRIASTHYLAVIKKDEPQE